MSEREQEMCVLCIRRVCVCVCVIWLEKAYEKGKLSTGIAVYLFFQPFRDRVNESGKEKCEGFTWK